MAIMEESDDSLRESGKSIARISRKIWTDTALKRADKLAYVRNIGLELGVDIWHDLNAKVLID